MGSFAALAPVTCAVATYVPDFGAAPGCRQPGTVADRPSQVTGQDTAWSSRSWATTVNVADEQPRLLHTAVLPVLTSSSKSFRARLTVQASSLALRTVTVKLAGWAIFSICFPSTLTCSSSRSQLAVTPVVVEEEDEEDVDEDDSVDGVGVEPVLGLEELTVGPSDGLAAGLGARVGAEGGGGAAVVRVAPLLTRASPTLISTKITKARMTRTRRNQ